ncbi:ABC transporter permease [Kitasatospora sp. NPDC057223]|uniref:ABC transporter permease n=1 Tax=Kitasatospora sp. NPDC057223 TaxID=3346055 RepID=UPI00363DE3F4
MSTRTTAGWSPVARAVTLLTGVLTALLIAFALPMQHLRPHHLPVAVVDPQATTGTLVQRLQANRPGAFQIDPVADTDTARTRILHRQDYGAIIVEPTGARVLTAGAASPAVAQLLAGLAATLQAPVTDVVPLPDRDPSGAGLAGGALPLVLGGWICALAMLAMAPGTAQRVTGVFAFAGIGSATFIAIEKYWFGSVTGNYALITAGVALGIAATAWTVLGLRSALGGRGLALAAMLIMLLGYPLSGLTTAPELLPAPLGTIGRLLPPGATGTLLRSTSFFHGHGAARPIAVLACWLAAGLTLFFIGQSRAGHRAATTAAAASAEAPRPAGLTAA